MKEYLFSITKKDFDIQTFRSGGKGGQHQNKTDSGVRIIHRESGAIGESREERSQYQNKKIAFKRLIDNPKFKLFISKKVFEIGKMKTIEEEIDESMTKENLKIEMKKDGTWEEENENL